jgi:hypothetical protein
MTRAISQALIGPAIRFLIVVLAAILVGQVILLIGNYSANASNWGWRRATQPAFPVTRLVNLVLVENEQGAGIQVDVESVDGRLARLTPAGDAYGSPHMRGIAHRPWFYQEASCKPARLFQWTTPLPATIAACRSANIGGLENGLTAMAVLDTDGEVWLKLDYTPDYLVWVALVGWLLFPAGGLIGGLAWAGRTRPGA